MQQIYLDNASTTFPKPQTVADAVYQYITSAGTNISRGTCATTTEDLVFATREQLCRFFGGEDSKNVVFTKNITESLNIIIKGLLHSGDHVLVTAMEHNAVMRPLQQIGTELTTANAPTDAITFSRIPCDTDGALRLDALPQLVRPNTKAIIMTHASNVCGTLQPLAAIGQLLPQAQAEIHRRQCAKRWRRSCQHAGNAHRCPRLYGAQGAFGTAGHRRFCAA